MNTKGLEYFIKGDERENIGRKELNSNKSPIPTMKNRICGEISLEKKFLHYEIDESLSPI